MCAAGGTTPDGVSYTYSANDASVQWLSGVITFAEERPPSNPTVVATARYTAPEGTEVYAEFVGPVETGTLSLRSEPPLRVTEM